MVVFQKAMFCSKSGSRDKKVLSLLTFKVSMAIIRQGRPHKFERYDKHDNLEWRNGK
jgi:hypothetical protein